jgi:DNA-binding MarR family transcriptional regulator
MNTQHRHTETEKKRELMMDKLFGEMKDTFFFQVHRIQKAVFRKGNQIFQEEKVPLQLEQFPILLTAHAIGGMSQQEIADVTSRDKSSIQRTLIALERKGLVRIEQDAEDKRRNLIYVTDAGKYLAEKIKLLMKRAEQETFAVLSDEDKKIAIYNMKEIADKLDRL